MENEKQKQVLVIRRIHNVQRQDYDVLTIEVAESLAEEQLSLPDKERNHTWRGVRYANEEEIKAYYKENPGSKPVVESKKKDEPKKEDAKS